MTTARTLCRWHWPAPDNPTRPNLPCLRLQADEGGEAESEEEDEAPHKGGAKAGKRPSARKRSGKAAKRSRNIFIDDAAEEDDDVSCCTTFTVSLSWLWVTACMSRHQPVGGVRVEARWQEEDDGDGAKKRGKQKRSRYIDDMAAEDRDAEEEDEEEHEVIHLSGHSMLCCNSAHEQHAMCALFDCIPTSAECSAFSKLFICIVLSLLTGGL